VKNKREKERSEASVWKLTKKSPLNKQYLCNGVLRTIFSTGLLVPSYAIDNKCNKVITAVSSIVHISGGGRINYNYEGTDF
jgi:hypothetical protein